MGSVQITARDAKTETIRILNYAHVRYTALACTMELRAAAKISFRVAHGCVLRVRVQARQMGI